MEHFDNIALLKGKVQHYDWGGYTFLPELLHFANPQKLPCAEYWMGAHASAPSMLVYNGKDYALNELIRDNPEKFIGQKTFEQFGELPYLFKVLDVAKMLSIQVHPSKSEAEKGFEREEKNGIALTDPARNYKDRNHKPEVMIALSEFWLLHGFKTFNQIEEALKGTEAFHPLISVLREKGVKGLYSHVMNMPQSEANRMLYPLVKNILAQKITDKSTPAYWVHKLFNEAAPQAGTDLDKGIFSVYFFNIVKAEKGEAIFQRAGLPHAYLEGQNMELMANSDNVLRGGLTSKHVDVPELLQHTSFEAVEPQALTPQEEGPEKIFHCPVPDFGISEITLGNSENMERTARSMEILFVYKGSAAIQSAGKTIEAQSGQAVAVLPKSRYSITSKSEETIIYKAFVP